MTDVDAILLAFIDGQPPRAIAEAHGLSMREVLAIVDNEAERVFSGEELRRQWLAQSRRLETVERFYFERAMRGDGDSAVIFLRAAERRASLMGLNAPQGHSVTLIHEAAQPQRQTGTDKIRAAIDRIQGRKVEAQQDPVTH